MSTCRVLTFSLSNRSQPPQQPGASFNPVSQGRNQNTERSRYLLKATQLQAGEHRFALISRVLALNNPTMPSCPLPQMPAFTAMLFSTSLGSAPPLSIPGGDAGLHWPSSLPVGPHLRGASSPTQRVASTSPGPGPGTQETGRTTDPEWLQMKGVRQGNASRPPPSHP